MPRNRTLKKQITAVGIFILVQIIFMLLDGTGWGAKGS